MRLEKYHGLGNDFLVLLDLADRQPVDEATARALCDRHRGVGADGLIRVAPGRRDWGSDVTMELFNADGGRAEMSGNGIRCLARAVVDAGLVVRPSLRVATDAGERTVSVLDDGDVRADMGIAKLGARPSPDHSARRSMVVDMGNPHLVIEVEGPDAHDLAAEAAPHPDLNVELVAAGPGRDQLRMRVWERGVGATQACGTGACAAAAAAHAWDLVDHAVTVHQPGGDALVELADGRLWLTGPAVHVATVEVNGSWR